MAHLIGNMLVDADDLIHDFVARRVEVTNLRPCQGIGVVKNNALIGGVLFYWDRGFDCAVAWASDKPAFMPWRSLYAAAFAHPDRMRLTAIIDKKNMRSRRFTEAQGWKQEGVHPLGIGGRGTAITYGMYRNNCRWLRGENGQERRAASTAAA